MTETIYIYTTDKYGNPGPYLTTFLQLQGDLDELATFHHWEKVTLEERSWAVDQPPVLMDQDNEIVAEVATLETLAEYGVREDGALFWEVLAREGWGLIEGLLGKERGVTFGRLREGLGRYQSLTGGEG